MADDHALEVPVRFYRTEMGTEPAFSWLRALQRGDCRAIGMNFMRVQVAGRRHCAREKTNEGGDQVRKKNPHIGSSLDDFLREEGILEEARATALKEALAWQVQKA